MKYEKVEVNDKIITRHEFQKINISEEKMKFYNEKNCFKVVFPKYKHH